jgi:hypothetical protein
VLAVMDLFTRRIIGFAVYAGDVNSAILCRMFNNVITGITPQEASGHASNKRADLKDFRWKTYCRDLVQLPLAA